METCSTSYGSILKGASPSLRVFFSVKPSVSLSGLMGNKGEITELNYQHRHYTNLPCIVFPAYFYVGLKSLTLRRVFLGCSLGLGSQTREGAVTCRMTWTFAKQKHTTTLLLGKAGLYLRVYLWTRTPDITQTDHRLRKVQMKRLAEGFLLSQICIYFQTSV